MCRCFNWLLIALLGLAIPMTAKPRLLTRVGKAYGASAKNMVTFSNKKMAAQQWLLVGAQLLDNASTIVALHACPHCQEANPLFGKRPSAMRIFGTTVPIMWSEATIEAKADEAAAGQSWAWINWIGPGVAMGLHGWAAGNNFQIVAQCHRAGIKC